MDLLVPFLVAALAGSLLGGTNASSGPTTASLRGGVPSIALPLLQAWGPEFLQERLTAVQFTTSANQGVLTEWDFAVTLDPAVASPGTLLVPFIAIPLVVTYNIPNLTSPLNLSRALLADVWAGNVTHWSDPALRSLNPNLNSTAAIAVIVPQGSAARTLAFTTALCSFSALWKAKFGAFSDSSGFAASTATILYLSDHDTSSSVSSLPYALSYIPLFDVITQGATFARLLNKFGVLTFPLPAIALDGLRSINLSSNLTASAVDLPALSAYPLLGLTYFHIRLHGASCAQQARLFDFLNWVLVSTPASVTALSMGYFPLPPEMTTAALYHLTTGLSCERATVGGGTAVQLLRENVAVVFGQ
eukprot:RCo001788